MLKPDAVQRGLMGEIIERFEARGFKLVALKFMNASADLLKTHYGDLSKKAFFPELIRYMGSGPVVPMVFEGLNAVKQGRTMLGATSPQEPAHGTNSGPLPRARAPTDVGRARESARMGERRRGRGDHPRIRCRRFLRERTKRLGRSESG